DDEIEREAADHASVSQEVSDFCSVARNRPRISWVGWKDAAQIALSGRTTKQLVVGRKKFHFAQRCDAQLHTRATHFFRSDADAFFNNSAAGAKLRRVLIEANLAEFEAHRAHALRDGSLSGINQIRQIHDRVPSAGNALIQFHYGLCHRGSPGAHS